MGFEAHHAVIVMGFRKEAVERVHAYAVEIGCNPTNIVSTKVNGYDTFMVPPDGSKEGWPESREGDARRKLFLARARVDCDVVVVRFGDVDPHIAPEEE